MMNKKMIQSYSIVNMIILFVNSNCYTLKILESSSILNLTESAMVCPISHFILLLCSFVYPDL